MSIILTNAVSFNMMKDILLNEETVNIEAKVLAPDLAREVLLKDGFISHVGHSTELIESYLGISVEKNRANDSFHKGDTFLVAQYFGPRLEEGATQLPEGAKLVFVLTSIK